MSMPVQPAPSDGCRQCGAALGQGAAYCTKCGAKVPGRGAVAAQPAAAQGAPSGAVPGGAPAQPVAIPGIIPVTAHGQGPVVPPRHLGSGGNMAARLQLVPAGAGRRLSAWIIDSIPPAVLLGVASSVGFMLSMGTAQRVNSQTITMDFTWLGILVGAASVLSLAYSIWLWGWQAKSGNTIGNALLGIRVTNMAGLPAGWLPIFLRTLLVSVASIVPTIGPILVVVSNAWDADNKSQGWHDKLAHTLVFNIKAGRNPLETGGIAGPESFAPVQLPPVAPIASPMAGRAGAPAPGPVLPAQQAPAPTWDPNRYQPPADPQGAVPTWAPPLPGAAHPDLDVEETRFRSVSDAPATAAPVPAAPAAVTITLDDGRAVELRSQALIGRNPAGYDGEMIETLLDVADASRSVSKTHLHLRVDGDGVWVTDRNSTNGSAITSPDGQRVQLRATLPVKAAPGSTVHFGDRSFVVGRR